MMNFITEHKKLIDVFPDEVGKIAQRLHQKKEDIPYVKKYFVADKQEKEEKERAVISYISTSIRDRDGDILLPEGVELTNYRKNPVVYYGHDYKGVPIGKNAWIKSDEKGLRAKTFFAKNQKADELYHAYTDDVEGMGPLLKGWSVGFIPLEFEDIEAKDKSKDKPGKKYTKWELLEYSAVGIPSCPEALTIAEEKGLISEFIKKDIEYMIERDKPEKEIEILREIDKSLIEGIVEGTDKMMIEDAKVETEWVIEKDDFTEEEIKKEATKREKEFIYGNNEIGIEIEGVISTKPETTDQYHRIPVNPGCEVTATITISASQGIKAIYCGKVKKVHTYLFDVNKWTMEEAKKWVADHKGLEMTILALGEDYDDFIAGKGNKSVISEEEDDISIEKGVIPYRDLGKVDEGASWDGPVQIREADESDLKIICTWYDSANPDIKFSYKLPHHLASGHKAVWKGVAAAMGALLGARGGVQIPSGDRKGVYNHLKSHYGQFDKEAPEFKEYEEAELKELFPEEIADKLKVTIDTSALEKTITVVKEQYEKLLEEKDGHIADLKEGRVLSRKHREIVKSAAVALQEVLKADAAGSREDEEQDETEKHIELIKDDKPYGRFIKEGEVTTEDIDERIQKAFIKAIENFNPKKLEEAAEKGMRLAIDKIKGRVR